MITEEHIKRMNALADAGETISADALKMLLTHVAGLDRDLEAVMQERDLAEEYADQLAAGVGKLTGVDVGEHTSSHCPWAAAIDAVESALANTRITPPEK
jgi:hypothetical protein